MIRRRRFHDLRAIEPEIPTRDGAFPIASRKGRIVDPAFCVLERLPF
jgi:hypothetical protein